jgi:hypothetical protein
MTNLDLIKKLLEEDKDVLILNNKECILLRDASAGLTRRVMNIERRNARIRQRISERETIIRVAEGKAAQAERQDRRSGYESERVA